MRFRLFAILFCSVIAGVSCIHEFPVTDHSFDFTGEIIYDSEADQHRFTLTCKKKSATDQFDIVFHVDGENVITLTDMDGVTHRGWFSESFADTDSRTYILSEASVGKHHLDMTISTEDSARLWRSSMRSRGRNTNFTLKSARPEQNARPC